MSKGGLKDTFDAMKEEFGESFDFKAYVCDVTNAAQTEQVIESIHSRFKRIDLLWNNAGYQGQIAPTLEYDPEDFAQVMNVNVTGAFTVLQAVAKRMAKQDGDGYSIVNTASVAGLRGTPAMIAYSSSKAAVLAMTVAASKDLAPSGIRVNAVSPALIGPGPMWERQNELHAKSGSPYFATTAEEVAENKINSVPMKRLGSVEEVLKSVAFLLSDEASYTTGINLVIDGGMSAGLKA
jgi:NAD(P)-dependent dehydrogenase (short-subunit alcohol dehydrogenase family)